MNVLQLDDEKWDSGLTQYALEVSSALAHAGHSVTFGARRGGKPEAAARALGLRVATFGSLRSFAQLIRSQKWDVINAHTGRTHSWSLLLRKRGTPVVRTRGDAREPRATPFDKFTYRATAAVIAASKHIAEMCVEHLPIPSEKLQVIYPGLAPSTFTPPPAARVGILGRLDAVKGHAVFLEAAALVLKQKPATQFLIAGAEAGIRFDLLKNQIEVLGISSAVTYLGRVPSAEEFMRGCTFGVIPSLGSEEISRAGLEWMAAGRALVGTLIGCLPELIEPGETGLIVPPNDGAALAEALLSCLNDEERTKKWGVKGTARLELHFSRKEQLQRTVAVYERVIGRISPMGPI
jgi:glycosyltransferase involved in cell wall biosynthesis